MSKTSDPKHKHLKRLGAKHEIIKNWVNYKNTRHVVVALWELYSWINQCPMADGCFVVISAIVEWEMLMEYDLAANQPLLAFPFAHVAHLCAYLATLIVELKLFLGNFGNLPKVTVHFFWSILWFDELKPLCRIALHVLICMTLYVPNEPECDSTN